MQDIDVPPTPIRSRSITALSDRCADTPADVTVSESDVRVRFHRRAHLPIISASGIMGSPVNVPWWNHRTLRMTAQGRPKTALLERGELYNELGGDYFIERQEKDAYQRRLVKQLERMGYGVALTKHAA